MHVADHESFQGEVQEGRGQDSLDLIIELHEKECVSILGDPQKSARWRHVLRLLVMRNRYRGCYSMGKARNLSHRNRSRLLHDLMRCSAFHGQEIILHVVYMLGRVEIVDCGSRKNRYPTEQPRTDSKDQQ